MEKKMMRNSDRDFWDSVAKPCSCYERRSPYAEEFLQKSGIREGESVFDMGCGSGTLCLPLADDGHEVFCCDFSENMLRSVEDTVREEGIQLITTKLLSWEQDWDKEQLPVCDLAFASRCLFNVNPYDAVRKLSSVAGRRVCVTLLISSFPFDEPGAPYEGGSTMERMDYLLSFLTAALHLGYHPQLSYMDTDAGEKVWAFVSWNIPGGQSGAGGQAV